MEGVVRNTAYKIWISDLISGKYGRGTEQFDSGYVEVKGNKVSRVNVIGGVIERFVGGNSISVSLDDGSGVLRLKNWNEGVNIFQDIDVGDLVLVVGKVREYNDYIYVVPEVLRKLNNPLWLRVRKLELTKIYGEPQRVEIKGIDTENVAENLTMNVVEEKVEGVNSRVVVLGLIEALDSGDGADFEDVIRSSKLGGEASKVIQELLTGGEIFEMHKGKLRVTG